MDILGKDKSLLLFEASNNVALYEYDMEDDESDYDEELEDELDYVDELEDDIVYNEQMVPVMECTRDYGNSYLVEYSDLCRLMESYDIDEVEALDKIAECNNINTNLISVVIESSNSILEKMEEIGAKGGSMLKKNIKANSVKKLKDLKDKGINLVKKKDKKNKSKKKKCKK